MAIRSSLYEIDQIDNPHNIWGFPEVVHQCRFFNPFFNLSNFFKSSTFPATGLC